MIWIFRMRIAIGTDGVFALGIFIVFRGCVPRLVLFHRVWARAPTAVSPHSLILSSRRSPLRFLVAVLGDFRLSSSLSLFSEFLLRTFFFSYVVVVVLGWLRASPQEPSGAYRRRRSIWYSCKSVRDSNDYWNTIEIIESGEIQFWFNDHWYDSLLS